MKPTLLILAAGLGSRYGGLKQLDGLGPSGETIMDYSVYDAARAGFGKVVFVIRPDFAEAFKTQLGARFEKRLPVGYAYQELGMLPSWFQIPPERQKPWGTGHAVLCAREAIQGPFAMVNADDYYGLPAFQAMATELSGPGSDLAMVGYRLSSTLSEHGSVARGVCELNADGTLKAVRERLKLVRQDGSVLDEDSGTRYTGEEPASMNFFGFRGDFYPLLQAQWEKFLKAKGQEPKSEFYIPMAVDQLVAEGAARVKVLRVDSPWFGVTYQEDKPRVQAALKALSDSGAYPADLKP